MLDELHKYRRWKNWLKSLYDHHGKTLKILVTGSAKLDLSRKGADSMFGRYETVRLHPFSIGELTNNAAQPPPKSENEWLSLGGKGDPKIWQRLTVSSGFPEPYHANNPLQYRRWVQRRKELVIRQDLRDITDIREISGVEQLALLLPERVGSPLSINSLREDLTVAHETASNWLASLDRIYYSFRIRPYSGKLNQSLRKEQKLYLWDWAEIEELGERFENMVASHLLKAVHFWNDVGYGEYDLLYWRDKQKREVDFVITNKRKPIVILECKLNEVTPNANLKYLGSRLKVPQIQLVNQEGIDQRYDQLRIVSAQDFLSGLP